MALDFAKRNRSAQGPDWGEINCGPIALLRSRISIRGTNYFRGADNRFVLTAVIEKDFVAVAHSAKIVPRSVIAHACPAGLALRDEVRPRIGGRFLFHEPEIFHAGNVAQASQPVASGPPAYRINLRQARRLPAPQPGWPCYLYAFDNRRGLFHNRHHAPVAIHYV
jgi:hypothetical protein